MALPRYLGQELFTDWTRRGNLGVDFFFVLSGFIIIFAHSRDIGQPHRLRNYLTRRFVRLFPVYWVYVGVFCLLVAIGFGTSATIPETFSQWISTFTLVRLDNLTFPIAPAWTLVHELAFYLVFALLIASRRAGIVVFGLWMVACVVLGEHPAYHEQTPWTTYLSPLNLNFLAGMLAYLGWKQGRPAIIKCAFPAGLVMFAAIYLAEQGGGAVWLGPACLRNLVRAPDRRGRRSGIRRTMAVGAAAVQSYRRCLLFDLSHSSGVSRTDRQNLHQAFGLPALVAGTDLPAGLCRHRRLRLPRAPSRRASRDRHLPPAVVRKASAHSSKRGLRFRDLCSCPQKRLRKHPTTA